MEKPTIENWSLVLKTTNPYQAPEMGSAHLSGDIYDDSRFADGSPITTGTVCKFDSTDLTASTRRTDYLLGEMSEEFQAYLDGNNIELSAYDLEEID